MFAVASLPRGGLTEPLLGLTKVVQSYRFSTELVWLPLSLRERIIMVKLVLYTVVLSAAVVCVIGVPQFNRASRRRPEPARRQPQRGSRADVAPNSKPGVCPNNYENVTYIAGDKCDTYIKCVNATAYPETCPDGLLFIEGRSYPCGYPQEVECEDRGFVDFQAVRTPGVCERDYEIFFSPKDDIDCGGYTTCAAGTPYILSCQSTHAFNAVTMTCEYADDVDTCDTEAYLGFSCEQTEFTDQEIGDYVSVPFPGECQKYYTCINKEDGSVLPRPQSCPEYTAFNSTSGTCSNYPHLIPGCEDLYPAELIEEIQQQKQQKQNRRQQRLLEIMDKILG